MRNFTDKDENEWLLDACDITSKDVDLRNHEGTLVIGTPDGEVEIMDICDIDDDENKYPADVIDAAREEIGAATREYDEKMTKIMDAAREAAPDKRIDNVEMLSCEQIYAARKDTIKELAVEMLTGKDLSIEINDSIYTADHKGGWIYMDPDGALSTGTGPRGNNYDGRLYTPSKDCVAELIPATEMESEDVGYECWAEMSAEERYGYLTDWCNKNNHPDEAGMITMDQVADDGIYGYDGLFGVCDLIYANDKDGADKFMYDLVADKSADFFVPGYMYTGESDDELLQRCATFHADDWVDYAYLVDHTFGQEPRKQEPYKPSDYSPVYDQCVEKGMSR